MAFGWFWKRALLIIYIINPLGKFLFHNGKVHIKVHRGECLETCVALWGMRPALHHRECVKHLTRAEQVRGSLGLT